LTFEDLRALDSTVSSVSMSPEIIIAAVVVAASSSSLSKGWSLSTAGSLSFSATFSFSMDMKRDISSSLPMTCFAVL
jgi:hypothetical protein